MHVCDQTFAYAFTRTPIPRAHTWRKHVHTAQNHIHINTTHTLTNTHTHKHRTAHMHTCIHGHENTCTCARTHACIHAYARAFNATHITFKHSIKSLILNIGRCDENSFFCFFCCIGDGEEVDITNDRVYIHIVYEAFNKFITC